MHKHTYETYKDMIKIGITLLQLVLRLQDKEVENASKDRTFVEV
jgi:hypothetical protein